MGSVATMFPVFHCALFVAAFTAANAETVSVLREKETRSNCPVGWLDTGLFGGTMGCLLFNSSTTYTWDKANEFCYNQGSELAEIRHVEEMEFVISYLQQLEKSYDWWTAGIDGGREGRWIWPSSWSAVESYVWYTNQPTGGAAYNCLCLEDSYSYKGNDNPCDSSDERPICQKK